MIDSRALRERRERIEPPPPERVEQSHPKDYRKGGGGSGFGFGIVRVASGNGTSITVTPAEEDTSEGPVYRMKALDAKTTAMKTWPGLKASDYTAFVFTGNPSDETPFVPVMKIGSTFYVWQLPKWDLQIPAPNVDFSDCTPVTRYP